MTHGKKGNTKKLGREFERVKYAEKKEPVHPWWDVAKKAYIPLKKKRAGYTGRGLAL